MLDVELTLGDYARLFRQKAWIVLVSTALCILLAVVWTNRQTPLYSSEASMLINQVSGSEIFDPLGTGSVYSYAERLAENEARFMNSSLVSDAAIERLGYEAYASVSSDALADVLTVRGVSEDPVKAQEIAQTYAETYIDVRQERFASARTTTANKLLEQIADIDNQILEATGEDLIRLQSLRRNLAQSLDLLSVTVDLADVGAAQIIDAANRPAVPFSPRVRSNVMLAAVFGLVLGVGVVLLSEVLDRSVRSREMLESLTPGAPNLALIPSMGKKVERPDALLSLTDPTGVVAESFRTLRAALQYVAVDERFTVLQVTSAHSAAGKTTVSANLAIALAQSGQRVAVIDADLRRPRLHRLFGVDQVPGLTSAIIGSAGLKDCVHRPPAANGFAMPFVLPSGPLPPGPAELLGSTASNRVMQAIGKSVDVVIVDTPPVLAVADAIVLSQQVDASILVVDATKTRREDVSLAFERLQQAGAPVVGTVLNKVPQRRGQYGYGYGYGGGYGQETTSWFSRRGRSDADQVVKLEEGQVPKLTYGADRDASPKADNGRPSNPAKSSPAEKMPGSGSAKNPKAQESAKVSAVRSKRTLTNKQSKSPSAEAGPKPVSEGRQRVDKGVRQDSGGKPDRAGGDADGWSDEFELESP